MNVKPIILTGLMLLLLLTSCSSSSDSSDVVPEPDNGNGNPVEQPQYPIGFAGFFDDGESKMASAPATRGVGDGEFTNTDLQASGFGVYCWYTGSSDFTTAYASTTVLMMNQKVEYINGLWTYSPSKYWPLNANEKLTFRAYAPYVSYQLQMDANGMPSVPVVVTNQDYHNGQQHDPLWGTGRLVNGTGEYNPLPNRASYDTEEDFEEALKNYYRYGTHYDNITYKMSGDWRDQPTDHDPADTRNGYIDWYFHHGMSKLMFTCSVIQDPGCDKVVIRSIQIKDLYTNGLLSLSSTTTSASDKPTWNVDPSISGDMTVTLSEATPDNTVAGDLAPAPGDVEDPQYHQYPFVIKTSTTQATDPADLLSHGLLIIPRNFTSEAMKVTITYSIDDETEELTATGTIEQNFQGNTSYTVRLSLTPSTKGLEISLVQGAFTPWHATVEGTHEVYNW